MLVKGGKEWHFQVNIKIEWCYNAYTISVGLKVQLDRLLLAFAKAVENKISRDLL